MRSNPGPRRVVQNAGIGIWPPRLKAGIFAACAKAPPDFPGRLATENSAGCARLPFDKQSKGGGARLCQDARCTSRSPGAPKLGPGTHTRRLFKTAPLPLQTKGGGNRRLPPPCSIACALAKYWHLGRYRPPPGTSCGWPAA